jgi:hypothetical protein
MKDVVVVDETPDAETLELIVTEKSVGTLSTNIAKLEALVEKRLEDYRPENYMGDADLAKKDRAELNKAKETIKQSRKTIISELMKPYEDFEERCKNLEKKIEQASNALDEIVKAKESEEKNDKRQKIELFWQTKNFTLFPLDKIFNEKWLNKTYKESSILDEMDKIIERTYSDLKTIERFAEAEEVETIKAHYLMNLDIVETMHYSEELYRLKEVSKQESSGREEREHSEQIAKQKQEMFEERSEISALAEQALELPAEERAEYVITIRCFDRELTALKNAMNEMGIEFSAEKLEF